MFRVCPAKGDAFTPQVEAGDGWFLQIEHFAKLIAGRKLKPVTTLEQSRDSVRIVAAEKESVRKGKRIAID
jgi:predicted dehydrogenase